MHDRATESNNLFERYRKEHYECYVMLIKTIIKHSLVNFRSTMYKIMVPKVILGIFDQFNEGNQQAPWMGTVHN